MRVHSQIDGRCLDEIRLQDMRVRCTIGVYPDEAARTQALSLNIALYLDTRQAARDGQLHSTVDYAALARELTFILNHGRFRLLESAAEALASYMLSPPAADQTRAPIQAVELEILKPEALRGMAIPSLNIFRQEAPDAMVEPLIFAAPEAALLRFQIPPQGALRLRYPDWHLKALLPAESGLTCDGRELAAGEELCQEDLEQSFFANKMDTLRTVLAVATREVKPRAQRLGVQPVTVAQSLYN